MDKIFFRDLVAEHPNRIRLVPVEGQEGVFDVTPEPGEVTQEGTPIRALEFNLLQDNAEAAIAEVGAVITGMQERNIRICSGRFSVVTEINTPTPTHVSFPPGLFQTPATSIFAVANPETTYIGVRCLGVCATNITTEGMDVYVTRTDSPTTMVRWMAFQIT